MRYYVFFRVEFGWDELGSMLMLKLLKFHATFAVGLKTWLFLLIGMLRVFWLGWFNLMYRHIVK
jgi:hypothetical protein